MVVGTGKTDYLSNFNSPWDIPNPFSKKRQPAARSRSKMKKEMIAFDHRQKIDKGFLRSKSKLRNNQ
jgi:hypothetical protein